MSTWHPSTCARCYIFSSPLELHSTFSSHSSIRTTFYHACVLLFASLVLLTNFPHQALRLKWKWISCHVMRHWLQNEWHWEKLFHVVVDVIGLPQGLMLMDTKQHYQRSYLFVRGHLNLASGPTGEKIGVEAASRFAMETDCFVLQHEGISCCTF